jgi:hypothetical protein
MARTITVGNTTYSLLDPSTLGFQHTGFSSWSSQTSRGGSQIVTAPSIQVTQTNPEKLEKCGFSDSRNPPNDCAKIGGTQTVKNAWVSQQARRGQIITAAQNASDQNNFTGAIDALKQLETYCLDMAYVFAEHEAYATKLRSYSWGTKDKWRCCQSNTELDGAKNTASAQKNVAWQEARSIRTSIKAIEDLQQSVNDSTTSSLQVEEQRARTNYQIALTNQEISKEGFVTSQFALSEGSGKLIYVVMALVAAFFVYRFVFRK